MPILRVLLIVTLAGISTATLSAQADVSTASLKGTVTDESRGFVPGATVTARSVERGITRVVATDSDGAYQIPFLQPGVYELRVEAKGFETKVLQNIDLTVGQIGVFDVQLHLGAVTAEVVVAAQTPLVETEKTQQANTIEAPQVANMPNIGRNFFNYVYTLPGVSSSTAPRAQGNGNFNFGTSGFSIGGSNGRSNLITVDGGENEFGDGEPRFFISPESVQEFQVNRNAFGAEFGFTSGSAVNVITRSGTNQFHGSGYIFYRSQKTSARNFFDRNAKKGFDQYVYPGVTFGGPLVRNKLFVFTSYEAIKSDTARFRRYTDNPALLGPTAAEAAYLARLNASGDSNLQRIGANLNAALNARNFPNTMKLLTSNEGTFTAPARIHMWSTRVDYQIGSNDSLSGRFALYHSDADQTGASNSVGPSNATDLFSRDYTTVVSWTHNFQSNLINQTRVQFAPNVSAKTLTKDPAGTELIIPGIGTFGRTFAGPFNTFENRYQFEDSLSWIHARHYFKFGGSYRPVHYRVVNELWFGGQWTFSSAVFPILSVVPAADQPALVGFNGGATGFPMLSALQTFSLGLPYLFRQGFGNPEWQDWANFLGLFAQDSWKISPRFTLDYGIRVDSDQEPKPLHTYNHVAPRLGFAWDPIGDQKTVIRGGSGIFYAPVYYQVDYLTNLLNDSGKYISQIFKTPASGAQSTIALWGAGLKMGKLPFTGLTQQDFTALGVSTAAKNPGRVIFDAAPDYKDTYSVQASLGITRQIVHDVSLDLAYQMYRGVHIQLDHEINYRESGVSAGPGLGPRLVAIDPSITQYNLYSSIGNSTYHGMTVLLTKRYSAHSLFNASYTFSKTIDDVTDYNSSFAAFLPTNLRLERGISSFNIKHNFVASGVFSTPWKAGTGQNPLSRAFADITLSPVIFLRSGIPFTALIGSDTNGDTHTSDRPFYAPRNSGTGEPFYGVDMRLNKQFYVKRDSGLRVDFIAEATNLFNHTNFLAVNNFVGTDPKYLFGPYNLKGSRDVPSTSPLGFTTAGDPRRIQFGLKIAF